MKTSWECIDLYHGQTVDDAISGWWRDNERRGKTILSISHNTDKFEQTSVVIVYSYE